MSYSMLCTWGWQKLQIKEHFFQKFRIIFELGNMQLQVAAMRLIAIVTSWFFLAHFEQLDLRPTNSEYKWTM